MSDTLLRPVAASERLLSLDVLRGLAVLGILAVNIGAFAMPFQTYVNPELSPFGTEGRSGQAWWAMYVFFEMKFVTLFSMLFGASLYLVGGERSDASRGALLRRRLFWLAVFGLLHGALIWWGDILLLYAWSGLFMMLMRSWTPGRLFWTGLAIVILGGLLTVVPMMALEYAPESIRTQVAASMAQQGTPESVQDTIKAMRGGLVSAQMENLQTWAIVQGVSLLVFVFRTVALMMMGLALFKWGFLTGRSPVWVYLLALAAGAASLWLVGVSAAANLAEGFPFPRAMGVYRAANELLSPAITLGYASALILLIKAALARAVLSPLAAVGRMAFTNYLTQSLIMTTVFYSGRGLGLFASYDRDGLWLFVFAVWALQLIWSPLWLSRFSMGPLEWVWRRLTYGRGLAATGRDQPQPGATAVQ